MDVQRKKYWHLAAVPLLLTALAFAASLTPSLIPREPHMQGILSGTTAVIGYGVGAFFVWLWRIMLLPELQGDITKPFRLLLYLASFLICAIALWFASDWQNATRAVMNLPPVSTSHPFQVVIVATVVFGALWLATSAFVSLVRGTGNRLSRWLPGRTGAVLGVLFGCWIFWTLINGVLVRQILEIADASFAAAEKVIDPGTKQPTDPMMTGSDASLIGWEELGNRGRDFISRTPTPEEISVYSGEPALRPVRVYVGRVSAPTARARAELALQETIRVGGFKRKLLIVTTPTGTGWMDPGSHDAIDFMHGGNTAHVAAQYSYLASFLSILTNVEYGLDQSRELFNVFYYYWSTLPEENRPMLYFHGLSQGALNSQATLPFLDTLGDPFHGALWVGSPFISPLWTHVREYRRPDSQSWRPSYGNGSLVRTTTQENVLDKTEAPWGPVRFVFLNYGSDPLVVFDFATIWRRPEWLGVSRPPDVSPKMRWYPLVTALQIGLDMTNPLGIPGYGHFYVATDYIDAWVALTDPPDWNAVRGDALRTILDKRAAP